MGTGNIIQLIIMLISVIALWFSWRSDRQKMQDKQEENYQKLMNAVVAEKEKEYETKAKYDNRFRDIEEEQKTCRLERAEETNERFNELKGELEMSKAKADATEERIFAAINALKESMNQRFEGIEEDMAEIKALVKDKPGNVRKSPKTNNRKEA